MLYRRLLCLPLLVAACGGDPAPDECNPGARESRSRYEHASVPFGMLCVAQVQVRTCDGGMWTEWSGGYTEESCMAEAARDCTDPAAAHGAVDERTRYLAAEVPSGETCESEMQTRTCSNGTWSAWSGTYTAETCVVADPALP